MMQISLAVINEGPIKNLLTQEWIQHLKNQISWG